MTKGEMLVWAATFAAHYKDTGDALNAARQAAEAVNALRHMNTSQLKTDNPGDTTSFYAILMRSHNAW